MCREHRREHSFLSPSIILNHFYHYCEYLSDTCTCKTSVPDEAYLIRHTERISLCAWTCCRLARKTLHLTSSLSLFSHKSVFPLHYWLFRIVAARLAVEGNCKEYNNEPLLPPTSARLQKEIPTKACTWYVVPFKRSFPRRLALGSRRFLQ